MRSKPSNPANQIPSFGLIAQPEPWSSAWPIMPNNAEVYHVLAAPASASLPTNGSGFPHCQMDNIILPDSTFATAISASLVLLTFSLLFPFSAPSIANRITSSIFQVSHKSASDAIQTPNELTIPFPRIYYVSNIPSNMSKQVPRCQR